MNIKPGKKLTNFCKTYECVLYNLLVCMTNNSNLKGIIKCPKVFCDRFQNLKHKCVNCQKENLLIGGYYNEKNEFCCYQCPDQEKIEIEKIQKPIENKDVESEDLISKFKRLEDVMVNQSKNKNFMKLYLDQKSSDIVFYNPMNSSPNPLVWSKQFFEKTDYKVLESELILFFKSYLDKFKEDSESCNGCLLEQTALQHMQCLDCKRNKTSPSIVKYDRFKGGE